MNKKFAVIFTVPIELKIEDGAKPDIEKVVQALTDAARKKLASKNYTPTIEEVYDTVPQDETGKDSSPGNQNEGPATHINLGSIEWEDADDLKDMQGHVSGESQREDASTTGETGDGGQNNPEEERGLHREDAGQKGEHSSGQS